MSDFNPDTFRQVSSTVPSNRLPERKVNSSHKPSKFIKGPIPFDWITAAAKLRGQALAVALAIWFRAGLERSKTVTLSSTTLILFGVGRSGKARGLSLLENAELIRVDRKNGKNPVITILPVPEISNENTNTE